MTFHIDDSMALLERTPRVLDAWLRGLPDEWARSSERPTSWSAFEVLGHLIHGERTDWIPRTHQILIGGDAATFEPFDRSGFGPYMAGKSMEELLEEFSACRAENVKELRGLGLSAAELERCGLHPEFGSVRLDDMLGAWTAHDLAHLAQISRAMARRYRGAVGPWEQYLPIVGSDDLERGTQGQ